MKNKKIKKIFFHIIGLVMYIWFGNIHTADIEKNQKKQNIFKKIIKSPLTLTIHVPPTIWIFKNKGYLPEHFQFENDSMNNISNIFFGCINIGLIIMHILFIFSQEKTPSNIIPEENNICQSNIKTENLPTEKKTSSDLFHESIESQSRENQNIINTYLKTEKKTSSDLFHESIKSQSRENQNIINTYLETVINSIQRNGENKYNDLREEIQKNTDDIKMKILLFSQKNYFIHNYTDKWQWLDQLTLFRIENINNDTLLIDLKNAIKNILCKNELKPQGGSSLFEI